MKMIKRMLALCTVLAVTIVMMMAITVTSHAYTEQYLATNDTWVSGDISTGDEADFYVVKLNKTGWLTVNYQGLSVGGSYVQILDENLQKITSEYQIWGSSDTNPKAHTERIMLEPGTYYVKVWSCYDYVGGYRVKASFKDAKNTEIEPNDGFETAQRLNFGTTVTGALTKQDRQDFYRIDLTAKTTIRVTYTGYLTGSNCQLYNSDLMSIDDPNLWGGAETNPLTMMHEYTLNPGTYFIKVYPNYDHQGTYKLKVIKKIMVNKISISNNQCMIPGKTFKLKATVGPSNATDKTIKWTTGDYWTASVDESTGAVTTRGVGKVKITANAQDGSNYSKTVTVIVKPKKATLYSLQNYSKKKIYFSCDYQSGATGYQVAYSTSSKFTSKTTKYKKFKDNSGYITKLTKGKKYYVKVRAYYKVNKSTTKYGAWSSKKSCKVTQ